MKQLKTYKVPVPENTTCHKCATTEDLAIYLMIDENKPISEWSFIAECDECRKASKNLGKIAKVEKSLALLQEKMEAKKLELETLGAK